MNQHRITPKQRYTKLAKVLLKNPSITQPTRKKGFGSSGLYTRGKLFAFLSYRNRLILKLPQERVKELVTQHKGIRWHPRRLGRGLKEWVALRSAQDEKWFPLAKEAMKFVASMSEEY